MAGADGRGRSGLTEGITVMIGMLAGLSGMALGWMAFGRDRRRDVKEDVKAFTRLEVLLEELGQKVGRLGEMITCLGREMNGHENRIVVLEQRVGTIERSMGGPARVPGEAKEGRPCQ